MSIIACLICTFDRKYVDDSADKKGIINWTVEIISRIVLENLTTFNVVDCLVFKQTQK